MGKSIRMILYYIRQITHPKKVVMNVHIQFHNNQIIFSPKSNIFITRKE